MARATSGAISLLAMLLAGGCGETISAKMPPLTLEQVSVTSRIAGDTREQYILRFEIAERIADAFLECARRKDDTRSIHIVDQFGNTIYAARMDGQFADNVEVARMKARAALYFRENTRKWLNRGREDPLMRSWIAQLGQFTSPVGLPIIVENQLLGAVGIGGASGDCAYEALTRVLGPQPPLNPAASANQVRSCFGSCLAVEDRKAPGAS